MLVQARFDNKFGVNPQFGAVADSPFLSKRCIVSKLQVGVFIVALIGYCGPSAGTAFGQAPVTWDTGYPVAHNAPIFQNIGSIEVFGGFIAGNHGVPTIAYFEWAPEAGGTIQTSTLEIPANGANGKFGKRNLNQVIAPVRVPVSKGKYSVKVVVSFSKANPKAGQPGEPLMLITLSQTQAVVREVK